MVQNINHLYHEGWDCVCSARRTSSSLFQTVVHCRSLVSGNIFALPTSLVDFTDESQTIAMALQAAFGWTRENKHSVKTGNVFDAGMQ